MTTGGDVQDRSNHAGAALIGGAASAPVLFILFVAYGVPALKDGGPALGFVAIFGTGALFLVFVTDFSHGFDGKKNRGSVHDTIQRSR